MLYCCSNTFWRAINMKVNIFKTAEEIGVAVARIFVDEVKNNPNCVLGLATGASPIPTYDNIKKNA